MTNKDIKSVWQYFKSYNFQEIDVIHYSFIYQNMNGIYYQRHQYIGAGIETVLRTNHSYFDGNFISLHKSLRFISYHEWTYFQKTVLKIGNTYFVFRVIISMKKNNC